MLAAAFIMFVYFASVWFQTIQDVSTITSCIHTIPLISTMAIAIAIAGGLMTSFGH